ncbi:AAA family ATPase [Plantactinospora siamensis]|uniref:AAA family ATPase n=1 Tax=Plantactinospora siamensis TaxID=555372 RepID=A0ABV6NZZ2_9ACTN
MDAAMVGSADAGRASGGGDAELVGRADECGRLDELLAAAVEGRGGALVLRGTAGVGKTALLDRCAARAGGMRVLRATGVPFEAELPFSALFELARPVLDLLDELPAQQADALRAAFALGGGPGSVNRLAAYVATLSLLTTAAERGPVLCLVDDAHWIDHASTEALLFTARRLLADRVAIVFAARPAAGFDAPGLPELPVSGLGQDAAVRLAMRSGLDRRVAAELAAATEGNPLALIELPATLTEGQRRGRSPLDHPLALAERIEATFLAQARGLPTEAWRALIVCALSEAGDLVLLERVLKAEGLHLGALDPAVDAGLIRVERQEVTFRHPLVRAAVHSLVGPGQRRSVHLAIAAALAVDPDAVDRRAWHLAAAATGPDEEVAALLVGSAERAQRRGGVVAGARAYERSARLTPDPDTRALRMIRAAIAWTNAGASGRAVALHEEALTLTKRVDLRCTARGALTHVALQHGDTAAADEAYLAEAEEYARTDPLDAGRMVSGAVNRCWARLDIAGMVSVCGRAVELLSGPSGPKWPKGPIRLATAQVLAGQPGGVALAREWMAASAERVDGSAAELAEVFYWIEDYDTARSLLEPEIRQARAAGDLYLLAYALPRMAGLECRTGRLRSAYRAGAEGALIGEQVGLPVVWADALVALATVEALLGEEAEALSHLESARGIVPAGYQDLEAKIRYAAAMTSVVAGRWTEAVTDLEWIEAVLRRGGVAEPSWLPVRSELAEAYAHLSRPDLAAGLVRELPADAARVTTRAAVARVRGMIAPERELDEVFAAALAVADPVVVPLERARTLLCHGQRLRRAKRRRDARDRLTGALALFENLGAQGWAQRCRTEISATGRQAPSRDDRAAGRLTAQERQIALHVAEGLTNREIATRIFLSPKTVEYHLGNVYRKLNLRSRPDLIRYLSRPPAPAAD